MKVSERPREIFTLNIKICFRDDDPLIIIKRLIFEGNENRPMRRVDIIKKSHTSFNRLRAMILS